MGGTQSRRAKRVGSWAGEGTGSARGKGEFFVAGKTNQLDKTGMSWGRRDHTEKGWGVRFLLPGKNSARISIRREVDGRKGGGVPCSLEKEGFGAGTDELVEEGKKPLLP